MKLFKIKVVGNVEEFKIEYTYSTDYFNYKDCPYEGTEQEKYTKFCEDLKADKGSQPLNVKLKMSNGVADRALPKKEALKITDVNEFVKRLNK
ncbi:MULTISPECIES: hypothetical protein [Clostridium]|uniref:hypothetical protein n=1 Tax=Clostridium TaxID=1485 RepID=UPI00082601A2|nr:MULTISPECIES: hypothetical protein [Clostridium]PJI07961.1 hypothetical protein CUB90_08805 [Clostridium sp. CT7]